MGKLKPVLYGENLALVDRVLAGRESGHGVRCYPETLNAIIEAARQEARSEALLSMGEGENQRLSSSSPALPTSPDGLTVTPYSAGEVLAMQLESIRLQLANWIKFDLEEREREGLSTDESTMIISPPFWPSHGQLGNWIKAISAAEELVVP